MDSKLLNVIDHSTEAYRFIGYADNRLDNMDKRFDNLEDQFEGKICELAEKIESKIDGLNTRIDVLRRELHEKIDNLELELKSDEKVSQFDNPDKEILNKINSTINLIKVIVAINILI